MRAIIFDVETTGLKEPEIIEAAWLDVDRLAEAHNALRDVENCLLIFERVMEHRVEVGRGDYEAIWRWSEDCRIPSIMPFSQKYKGLPMTDVPESFRAWYRKVTDPLPDPYILKAFEKYPAKYR